MLSRIESREQLGLLEHVGDLGAQAVEGEIVDPVAVDPHLAFGGLVEAGNEVGEAGLAGTGGADEGDDLADPWRPGRRLRAPACHRGIRVRRRAS